MIIGTQMIRDCLLAGWIACSIRTPAAYLQHPHPFPRGGMQVTAVSSPRQPAAARCTPSDVASSGRSGQLNCDSQPRPIADARGCRDTPWPERRARDCRDCHDCRGVGGPLTNSSRDRIPPQRQHGGRVVAPVACAAPPDPAKAPAAQRPSHPSGPSSPPAGCSRRGGGTAVARRWPPKFG